MKKRNRKTAKQERRLRIRRRIFGLTSVALSVLIANLPVRSQAALVPSYGSFHIVYADTQSAQQNVQAVNTQTKLRIDTDGSDAREIGGVQVAAGQMNDRCYVLTAPKNV
ncbi:MAG: hypothetical protein IJP92_15295, partial [Lachnospiraceae bacterium]|nr:hypothetical protein [Lachnospiraceae bacterium]